MRSLALAALFPFRYLAYLRELQSGGAAAPACSLQISQPAIHSSRAA